ncbi:hypothetical protein DICVIV_13364 [Dictyocaulus viviparus]|uniref:Amino acid permease/ SLC12A domain-containing protein n=1 Tax=Dictyocaulus viviparus TaxID=29172 RepID=A0A0D8X812_DICVI|nr:hypothetical protein DICVIV_13364 [Dictyocaulus viviparus]
MIKFIPIFLTFIIGVCTLSIGGNSQPQLLPKNFFNNAATDFFKLTPFLGIFGSLSSVIFAYGGFYSITSLRTKMKDPNKNGIAILLAITVISVIYFLIAIVMTFSHPGEVNFLIVTERLSVNEIKNFTAQDQSTKLRVLTEMSISDKAICSSIARCQFH